MQGAALCEPWPLEGCCDFTELAISPDVTGAAHMAASRFLWLATGQRYGNCLVALRPCRNDCSGIEPRIPTTSGAHDFGYPWPALYGGRWINIGCGCGGSDCSCTFHSEVVFADPVRVEQVLVDGAAVPFTLISQTRLIRADGQEWPLCQDFSVTGGPGTWIVNARVGEDVPSMGRMAVANLTCELAKACAGQECSLPEFVTSVTRNGISMETTVGALQSGLSTGLMLPDLFIKSENPSGLQDRGRAYSPDWQPPRGVQ